MKKQKKYIKKVWLITAITLIYLLVFASCSNNKDKTAEAAVKYYVDESKLNNPEEFWDLLGYLNIAAAPEKSVNPSPENGLAYRYDGMEKVDGIDSYLVSFGEDSAEKFSAERNFAVNAQGGLYELNILTSEYEPINGYSYSNETYEYAVNIPYSFDLSESSEEGAVFKSGNGAVLSVTGDWSDIGSSSAITNAYESAVSGANNLTVIDSFFEDGTGYGVFGTAAKTSDDASDTMTYLMGAQYGRAIVMVSISYPVEDRGQYLWVAKKLMNDLLSIDIPDTVIKSVINYKY